MNNKWYDCLAALALVFDVDWDTEFPGDGYGDWLWESEPRLALSINKRDAGGELCATQSNVG